MADNDFPRLLYRKSESSDAQPIWGLGKFEVFAVADLAAQDDALAEGWTLRPDDEPAKPKARKTADPQPAPAQAETEDADK